jgi:hypothetical protein
MAVLHLPLTLTPIGIFERAATEENIVGSRLRLFVLSGAGEYLKLPSPGIRAMWVQFYNMGMSSRFCDIMEEDKRRSLELIIKEEVNGWFKDIAEIQDVKLLGDEQEDNGIKFRTENKEYVYTFKISRSEKGLKAGTIGPWNIIEATHDVY